MKILSYLLIPCGMALMCCAPWAHPWQVILGLALFAVGVLAYRIADKYDL